jgi:hypothetical protein
MSRHSQQGPPPDGPHRARRHLEIEPSHAASRFWLAACTGNAAGSGAAVACPPEMVAGLFDQYADKFDSHLVEVLQYRTPQLLRCGQRGAGTPRKQEPLLPTLMPQHCRCPLLVCCASAFCPA